MPERDNLVGITGLRDFRISGFHKGFAKIYKIEILFLHLCRGGIKSLIHTISS